jgi:hypothetical protein
LILIFFLFFYFFTKSTLKHCTFYITSIILNIFFFSLFILNQLLFNNIFNFKLQKIQNLFLLYITSITSYFYYKTKPYHKILYQTHPMSSLSVCEFAYRVEICLDYINYWAHWLWCVCMTVWSMQRQWNRAFLELLQKANIMCTSLSCCLNGFSPRALGDLSFL